MTGFEVKRVTNGIILKDDEGEELVFQDNDDSESSECDNWASFLYYLTDQYGPDASKYSKHRVYTNVAPGYDHDDWETIECPLCWRKPQEGEFE